MLLGLAFVAITAAGHSVFDVLIAAIGACITVAGAVQLVAVILRKVDEEKKKLLVSSGISMILLGVIICLTSNLIVGILGIVVALVVLVFGAYQLLAMVSAFRVVRFSALSFVMPILVTVCGAVLLFGTISGKLEEFLGYICGAALILSAISEIIAVYRISKSQEEMQDTEDDCSVDEQ